MKKWLIRILVLMFILIGGLTAAVSYIADKPTAEQQKVMSETLSAIQEAHRETIPENSYSFGDVLLKGLVVFIALAFFIIVLRSLDERINRKENIK